MRKKRRAKRKSKNSNRKKFMNKMVLVYQWPMVSFKDNKIHYKDKIKIKMLETLKQKTFLTSKKLLIIKKINKNMMRILSLVLVTIKINFKKNLFLQDSVVSVDNTKNGQANDFRMIQAFS